MKKKKNTDFQSQEFYSKIYGEEWLHNESEEIAKYLLNKLSSIKLTKIKKVLDAGCGIGTLGKQLRDKLNADLATIGQQATGLADKVIGEVATKKNDIQLLLNGINKKIARIADLHHDQSEIKRNIAGVLTEIKAQYTSAAQDLRNAKQLLDAQKNYLSSNPFAETFAEIDKKIQTLKRTIETSLKTPDLYKNNADINKFYEGMQKEYNTRLDRIATAVAQTKSHVTDGTKTLEGNFTAIHLNLETVKKSFNELLEQSKGPGLFNKPPAAAPAQSQGKAAPAKPLPKVPDRK